MEYTPATAVWEVTMGCNMRCGHCGSSCEDKLPDELTTDEALLLADQMADIGLRWVTLSGGEPLTRKDLPMIIKRLSTRSVAANIITNGWLIETDLVEELKQSGVSTIAISIDGTQATHDKIRCKGSFQRALDAFHVLNQAGVDTAAVTTISNENIHQLPEIRDILINNGVKLWQVQIGFPEGNFKNHPEWLVTPDKMNVIIDFCYETSLMDKIKIYPADCVGYYSEKELKIKRNISKTQTNSTWRGCNAGVHVFGVLHNGDITGCTSIRDRTFIEGNIRETSLKDIWENPDGFAWRRKMTKSQLSGDCEVCVYGNVCLGGCPNTRLTINGDIYTENLYCAYNLALKKLKKNLQEIEDVSRLNDLASRSIASKNFQSAAIVTSRILEISPNNIEALALNGFAEFMCGNYTRCAEANRKVLEINPDDVYATKGLGLSLHELGDSDKGLELLEKAAMLTDYKDADIINDLNYIKQEINKEAVYSS